MHSFIGKSECFQANDDMTAELAIASETIQDKKILVVQLMGRLFYKTERDFRYYVSVELPKLITTIKVVYIDFQHVSYIDSLGFASLLSLLNQMKQLDIVLRFQNLPKNIKELFLVSPLSGCIDDQSLLERGTSLFTNHKKLEALDAGVEVYSPSSKYSH